MVCYMNVLCVVCIIKIRRLPRDVRLVEAFIVTYRQVGLTEKDLHIAE